MLTIGQHTYFPDFFQMMSNPYGYQQIIEFVTNQIWTRAFVVLFTVTRPVMLAGQKAVLSSSHAYIRGLMRYTSGPGECPTNQHEHRTSRGIWPVIRVGNCVLTAAHSFVKWCINTCIASSLYSTSERVGDLPLGTGSFQAVLKDE